MRNGREAKKLQIYFLLKRECHYLTKISHVNNCSVIKMQTGIFFHIPSWREYFLLTSLRKDSNLVLATSSFLGIQSGELEFDRDPILFYGVWQMCCIQYSCLFLFLATALHNHRFHNRQRLSYSE